LPYEGIEGTILQGRVILNGLSQAIVEAMADAGADVVCGDIDAKGKALTEAY
jgi:hypothetical protein